ncbi:MAG: thiamine-phosphate pyrophosphorylase [Fibrobacterota bacterium]
MTDSDLYRVLDANFNRLREGLRVIEEVVRLVKNDGESAATLKSLRHAVAECEMRIDRGRRLRARDSEGDVGRAGSAGLEGERKDLADITASNFKRCQEAARTLEEFTKLVDVSVAEAVKEIRFRLYDMEKMVSVYPPKL